MLSVPVNGPETGNRFTMHGRKFLTQAILAREGQIHFFELIKQCKEDQLPGGQRFVRIVSDDSSPSCVLGTDRQLSDLKRFCTNPDYSCVLGIDPTFNLGKFYVTVTTYTNLH